MQPSALLFTRWQDLPPHEQDNVLLLSVNPQQVEFAGTVERAIAACEADIEDDVAGLAIRASGGIVGFLVLKRRSKAPEWSGSLAATVCSMRIDQDHQGRGIGSAALQALPKWVTSNWPETSLLMLSVDAENTAGIRAYTNAGFQDHGMQVQGRIGWVRYMSKPITSPNEAAL